MSDVETGLKAIHKVLKDNRALLMQIRDQLAGAGEAMADAAEGGPGDDDAENQGTEANEEEEPEAHGERRGG